MGTFEPRLFLALDTRTLWGAVLFLLLGDEEDAFDLLFLVLNSFLPFFSRNRGWEVSSSISFDTYPRRRKGNTGEESPDAAAGGAIGGSQPRSCTVVLLLLVLLVVPLVLIVFGQVLDAESPTEPEASAYPRLSGLIGCLSMLKGILLLYLRVVCNCFFLCCVVLCCYS